MKNHTLFLFVLFFISSVCQLNAQDVDDLKKQMNNIKRSSEFIYGQAAGENEETCYEIAYESFMQKFKEYIQNDSILKDAEAVIMPSLKSKVKKISFERYIDSKVVCLYVSKKDIMPLYKKDIVSIHDIKTDTLQQRNNTTIVLEMTATDTLCISSNPIDSITTVVTSEHEVVNSPNRETNSESLSFIGTKIVVTDEKAFSLLNEIANAKNFDAIKKILEQRKSSEHDVMFKPTMNFSAQNAYWAIFDKTKMLIALLNKEKTIDLISNHNVDYSMFADKPKIWIQIY